MVALLVLVFFVFFVLPMNLISNGIRFWKWQKEYRRQRVNKKMAAELKKFGPLFVVNKRGDVTAVCTERAFSNLLGDWKIKVIQNPEARWGKPIFSVHPIFTFTSGDVPFCTGSRENAENIMVNLIYDLLGGKYDRSTIRKAKNLAETIVRSDNRLLVPFVGDKWQSEWDIYRQTDMNMARRVLHLEVLKSLSNRSDN